MADWLGLGFIFVLFIGAIVGLKRLSKMRVSTADEFERNAAEGKTMLGAAMSALQELTDPAAPKANQVIEQMKDGRYLTKRQEGKSFGEGE